MATSPATSAALNRLLREFKAFDRIGGGVSGGALGDHEHAKESIPTILVAASNARPEVIAMADLVCSGSADHIEIVAAINIVGPGNGRIVLSEGDFHIDPDFIILPGGIEIYGMGKFATTIQPIGVGSASSVLVELQTDGGLHNLGFDTGFGGYLGRVVHCNYGTMSGIFHQGHADSALYMDGGLAPFFDFRLEGIYTTAAIHIDGLDVAILSDITRIGGTGPLFYIDGTNGTSLIISNIHVSIVDSDGIVIKVGTRILMSNISINVKDGTCILVDDDSPFAMIVKGAHLIGEYGIRTINNGVISQCLLSDISIDASISGIDARFGSDCTLNDITINHGGGPSKGTGVGAKIRSASDAPITISNLKVRNFDLDGIRFESLGGATRLRHLKASQLHVDNVGQHGIVVDNTYVADIHDSEVEAVGTSAPNTYDGIHVTGDSKDVVLHHNKIKSLAGTRYGIHVESGLRAIVVGNDLGVEADYGTLPFKDGGSGTILSYPADAVYGDNFVTDAASLLVQQIVDKVGVITDVALGTQEIFEDVGVTDTVTHSAPVVERSVTETVGISDSVVNIETKAHSDDVGVIDVVSYVLS